MLSKHKLHFGHLSTCINVKLGKFDSVCNLLTKENETKILPAKYPAIVNLMHNTAKKSRG